MNAMSWIKKICLLGIVAGSLCGCQKKNVGPYGELPESIVRLMDNKACACDPRIALWKWGEQLLYVHYHAGPHCNSIMLFFDLDGNEIQLDQAERNQLMSEREVVKIIWECGK